jgi:hypothetical protein
VSKDRLSGPLIDTAPDAKRLEGFSKRMEMNNAAYAVFPLNTGAFNIGKKRAK